MASEKQLPRILVVDDEPINRQVYTISINHMGYAATAVDNGLDAIKAVLEGDFDLILMDCLMPEGIDGFETTRRIREHEKSGATRIPIVGLSGLAHESDQERCFEAGMDDFVGKPIAMQPLADLLERWVGATESVPADPGPLHPNEANEASDEICEPETIARHRRRGTLNVIAEVLREDEPQRLARMDAALQERNGQALANLAHGLAGVAGTLGATGLRKTALHLEETARKADFDGCRNLITDVTQEVEMVMAFMDRQAANRDLGSGEACLTIEPSSLSRGDQN